MELRFAGGRAGTGPLAWGQRAIWDAIVRTAPDDRYFNFGRVLAVPGKARPLTPARAAEALGALVARHESLRTRLGGDGPWPPRNAGGDGDGSRTDPAAPAAPYPAGEGGRAAPYPAAEPYQVLEAAGAIPVAVAAGDPERLLGELEATAFDYAAEWPLRAGLVVDGGEVTHIVLVFCHLAADGLGSEVVLRDLRLLLLRGAVPGPPPPQPMDLARWQESEAGRRVAGIAAGHWEREYRRVPPTMFGRPDASGAADPPIWRAQIVSRAMDLAVSRIAAVHSTSVSTALLAAASAMVGTVTGHGVCAMLPLVGNRFRGDTANTVSTLAQEGLFVLDLDRGPFTELLRAAGPAALRAYRSAYHDPRDRERLTAEASRERGTQVHPYCCFNDLRAADRPDASPGEAEVRRALAETTLSWPLRQERLNCRFCLHVTDEPGGLSVSLTADTRFLPRPAMERYLLGLESLLVEAAFHDVPAPVG
ncbi:hypothetical protein [Planomonospora sp. ID82291]|uniref:hypothetical protein n=1 Tax=Planomonospora sp. ID82291 TaxID=2738136 RepID=UPI0018C387BE|nr:hypothetical protein [Planomonospora sp. ID82291]MBG0815917.1 non-ribosomal peptide synthetase condensation domain protein [Planomonospora sp. ID82291]